jgi:hypothetical protein
MVPSAYLRVFQPLEGFERGEQLHWERYLLHGRPRPDSRPRYADRQTAPGLGLIAPAGDEHAEVRVIDGRTYLSPHRTRMRVLAALVAFWETGPDGLIDALVPRKEAKRARRELARQRRRDPGAVVFAQQSAWYVPLRWFVLFSDEERHLGDDELGRTRLRYLTSTRRAMRRIENAVPVLRRSDLGPIGDLLVDLHRWMASFDSRSLLELDYAELCDSMTWDELDDDHSAAEMSAALEALHKHEYRRSADAYQRVLSRWEDSKGRDLLN